MYRSLQSCRALAALLVVLFHLGGILALDKYFGSHIFERVFSFGDAGVEFFFVLSGFIITSVHAQDIGKPTRFLRYLRKRAVRIYPVYWIIFSSVFLLARSSASLEGSVPHDWADVAKSLALVPQDPTIVGGTGAPVIIVAWSLQYEILFYALVALFILNRSLGLLFACGLFINLVSCHFEQCTFPRSFLSSNLIFLFGYGALIALLCKRSVKVTNPMLLALLGAAAFLAVGALEDVLGIQMWIMDRRLAFGFLSGIVIFALVRAEDSGKLSFESAWLTRIGDSSYSLYLIHFPLLSVLCKLAVSIGLTGAFWAIIAFPTFLAACIFAASVFYLVVERPVLRFLSSVMADTQSRRARSLSV